MFLKKNKKVLAIYGFIQYISMCCDIDSDET